MGREMTNAKPNIRENRLLKKQQTATSERK
jgi:hypothetical protein